MNESARIFDDDARVTTRLFDLNLTVSDLQFAIQYAASHAFECTQNDVRSLAGYLMYARGTRGLRDRLAPDGWVPTNTRNLEAIASPDGELSIIVASGDAFTGIAGQTPSTRNDKGPLTREAVQGNQLHFTDYYGDSDFPRPTTIPPKQTWILLHYTDKEKDEIRLELSLPVEMSDAGYVHVWQERIVLSPVSFADVGNADDDDDDDDGQLDVPVTRR